MEKFPDDDHGQLILIACVSIAVALVLIATYGYYTIGTGENSINREDMNSFYYYQSIRDNYMNISHNQNNVTLKNEMKASALLHGYSVDFGVCSSGNSTIIFIDKDIQIREEVSC